jgi:glutaredoxin
MWSNAMKSKAVFYHAGCPVCVSAERMVADAIDRSRFDLSVVHLGKDRSHLSSAEKAGVKSVPALVLDNQVFHINFGASLADVAKG